MSAELDAAQQGFRDGTMTGEDFAAKLAEIDRGAQDAFASLSDVDRAQFSGVMSQLSRLGGVIASVTAQAAALVSELAKAAQIDPGTKQLDALRQQHAAQQASMDGLDAMREANERFNASEAARNALTSEGVKLEREKEAVRKRAAEAGATLTDTEITRAAQAALDGDAARSAADKAANASGGGKGKSGGSGAPKLDAYAQEAKGIRDRTLALQTEATVLATVALSNKQYGDAVEYASTKARLLIAAQEAGKQITPELEHQIDALAQSYSKAGVKAEEAAQKVQEADAKTEKGASALNDLFQAGLSGSEAFGNALRNLAAELLQSQVLKLLMQFGKSGLPGSGVISVIGSALGGGGFSEGGFTGNGGKHEPAGVVHRGEYVSSQESVKRIGADRLEQLHRAAKSGATGYATGGLVGGTAKLNRVSGTPPSASMSNTQNISLAPQITINTNGGGTPEANADLARQVSQQTEKAMRGLIQDELIKQMRAGGMLRR